MKSKILIPLLLVLVSLLVISFLPGMGPHNYQGNKQTFSPDINAPSSSGQWTNNGSLVILFYDDQLGFDHPVLSNSTYHYASVYGEAITPGQTHSVHIQVTQYNLGYRNVTITMHNQTGNYSFQQRELVKVNVQKLNQTVVFPHHNMTVFQVKLPSDSSLKYVSIDINGAVFNFQHISIPGINIMPFSQSPLETWLLAILFLGVMFLGALSLAIAVLKRVIYVPPVGPALWSIVLIGILGAVALFLYAFYYDLPYIPWFGYLIPVFTISFFFVLEKLSNIPNWTPVKSVYLFGIDDQGGRRDPIAHRKRIFVAEYAKKDFKLPETEQYSGWVKLDPNSRLEALKRLFGVYTPITWKAGPKPWIMDLGAVSNFREDDKFLIFTDPKDPQGFNVRELEKWTGQPVEKETKKRFREFLKKRGLTKRFHIPVSGHHYKHIARFIEGYETTSELGDIVDTLDAQVNKLEVLQKINFLRKRGEKYDMIAMELALILYPEDPEVKEILQKRKEQEKSRDQGGKSE